MKTRSFSTFKSTLIPIVFFLMFAWLLMPTAVVHAACPTAPDSLSGMIINEIDEDDSEDVEVYNTTGSAIDISGWQIYDNGGTGLRATVPGAAGSATTMIPAGGWYTFNTSSLNGGGDTILLYDPNTNQYIVVSYTSSTTTPSHTVVAPVTGATQVGTTELWPNDTSNPTGAAADSLQRSPDGSCSIILGEATFDAENLVLTPEADLSVTKDDAVMEVNAGGQTTYTITVSSDAGSDDIGVLITDTLDANTTYVSSSAGGMHNNGVITWNIPTLTAGGSETLTVTVLVDALLAGGTVFTNTVVVTNTAGTADTAPGNETAQDESQVPFPPALLYITEVLYDSCDGDDDAEYVVVCNDGTDAVDMAGYQLGDMGVFDSDSSAAEVDINTVRPDDALVAADCLDPSGNAGSCVLPAGSCAILTSTQEDLITDHWEPGWGIQAGSCTDTSVPAHSVAAPVPYNGYYVFQYLNYNDATYNQDGDTVVLFDTTDTPIACVSYGDHNNDTTLNGTGCADIFAQTNDFYSGPAAATYQSVDCSEAGDLDYGGMTFTQDSCQRHYEGVCEVQLDVMKAVSPAAADPGDTITFTISITNSSNITANVLNGGQAMITDTFSADLTNVSCDTGSVVGNELTAALDVAPNGVTEIVCTATIVDTLMCTDVSIDNSIDLAYTRLNWTWDDSGATFNDDYATCVTEARTALDSSTTLSASALCSDAMPSIDITKTAAIVGTDVQYTIELSYTDMAAADILITDTLSGLDLSGATCTGDFDVASGTSTVAVDGSGISTTVCTIPFDPTLTITKTPSTQEVSDGGTANFGFDITAGGTASGLTLSNLALSDPQCDSAPTASATTIVIGGTDSASCAMSGVTADFTNYVTATADYAFTNVITATVSGDPASTVSDFVETTGMVTGTSSANVTVTVPPTAEISVTKSVEPMTPLSAGDTITFTITITNGGSDAATGVTISDTLLSHLTAAMYSEMGGGGAIITTPVTVPAANVIISEIDPDQAGTDMAEFVELQTGTPGASLAGYCLVLFNGSNDTVYSAQPLTGTSDANGYFVVNYPSNGLQNGADAVALYSGACPAVGDTVTAVGTANLVDAIVYGTGDADATGLLTGLGETTQYNDTADLSIGVIDDSGTIANGIPSEGGVNNGNERGGCNIVGTLPNLTADDLLAGASCTFVVSGTVNESLGTGVFTNTVEISATNDVITGNNVDTAPYEIVADDTGTLVISKITAPNAVSTAAFTLTYNVTGTEMTATIIGGERITITGVPSGTHTFTETVPSADWLLSGVAAAFDADDSVTLANGVVGDIDVTAGLTTVVTITNTRSFGTLIFEKMTDPVDDTAVFTITHDVALADGTMGGSFPLTSGAPVTVTDVVSGVVTFSEDDGDYTLDSVVCDTGGDETGVRVTAGMTTTCTLTNIRPVTPTITIDKEAERVGTTLTYTITIENISTVDAAAIVTDTMDGIQADYCLDEMGATIASPISSFVDTAVIMAGQSVEYVCVATVDPQLDVEKTPDIQGIDSDDTANFTIAITASNNATSAIVMENVTITDGATTSCETGDNGNFAGIIGSAGLGSFSVVDTCSHMNVTADFTNTIEVSADIAFTNTVEASIVGVPNSTVTDVVTYTDTITDSDSAVVTVTMPVTPIEPGTLVLSKVTVDGDTTTAFTITHNVVASPTVPADVNIMGGQTITVTGVTSGTYTIAEIVPAGWFLAGTTCMDSVTIIGGETVTCTFTNDVIPDAIADVAITKNVDPAYPQNLMAGDAVTFTLDIINNGSDMATNVMITDVINANITGTTWTGSGSNGVITTTTSSPLVSGTDVIISEVDPDQAGTDTAEFIELMSGTPNRPLDGYCLVLFNGSSPNDAPYQTIPLTGTVSDGSGVYTIAVPGLQNGADAIGLYSQADCSTIAMPTTVNLVDAVVYGTNDADDSALLIALGETIQYNDTVSESLSVVDGSGVFTVTAPTSNTVNVAGTPGVTVPADCNIASTGASDYSFTADDLVSGATCTITITGVIASDAISGTYTNTAAVAATNDVTLTNNTADAPYNVIEIEEGAAGIAVEKQSVLTGNTVAYTFYVTNTGDVTATYIITDISSVTDTFTIVTDIAPNGVYSDTYSQTINPMIAITTTALTSPVVAGTPAEFLMSLANTGDTVLFVTEIVDPTGACDYLLDPTGSNAYIMLVGDTGCNVTATIPTSGVPVTHTVAITAEAVLSNRIEAMISGTTDVVSDFTIDTITVTNGSQDVVTVTIPITPVTPTQPGTLVLEKVTVNGDTTTPFTITHNVIASPTVPTAVTILGGQMITVTGVTSGTYNIAEMMPDGWFLAGTTCLEMVTVGDGETVTCTFMNDVVSAEIADVMITKSVEPTTPLMVGDAITFTLDIVNNGRETAMNVTVMDVINGNISGLSWMATGANGIVTTTTTTTPTGGVTLVSGTDVIISEIDADQAGTDTDEFIELMSGTPNQSLDGYCLVLFNGASPNDEAYQTIPLTGTMTAADGVYTMAISGLQNGADAVGLYNQVDCSTITVPTTTNLVDAIVYGSNDAADTALLSALGETIQHNDTISESLSVIDGSGMFTATVPTSATVNVTGTTGTPTTVITTEPVDCNVTETGATPYAFATNDLIPGGSCRITITGVIAADAVEGDYINNAAVSASNDITITNNAADAPYSIVDGGEELLGSIGSTVYHDLNGNGSQDAGESGLGGVLVALMFPDGMTATATTEPDGSYLFENLPFGTYALSIDPATLPADKQTISDDPDGGIPNGLSTTTITTTGLVNDLDENFGVTATDVQTVTVIVTETVTVTDTVVVTNTVDVTDTVTVTDTVSVTDTVVFTDTMIVTDTVIVTDTNNVTETITVTDTVLVTDTIVTTNTVTVTDTMVTTDTVIVTETMFVTDTLTITDTVTMVDNVIVTNTITNTVTITNVVTIEIPEGMGAIGDTIWYDVNQNGVFDEQDAYLLEGIEVRLDNGIQTVLQTTGADGVYLFSNLSAGEYVVTAVVPDGYGNTTTLQYNITLGERDTFLQADFAFVQVDYGDLPTSLESATDPARHIIDPLLMTYIGTGVDAETAPESSMGAIGDTDLGVSTEGTLALDEPFTADITVFNDTGETVYVGGYIDLNGDGVFSADEYAQADVPFDATALTQAITLSFNAPTVPGELFGRFRVSTDEVAVQSSDGIAPNGEVEDYLFIAGAPTAVAFTQVAVASHTMTFILSIIVALTSTALFISKRYSV